MIDNEGIDLRPGMFGKVRVPVQIHDNAVLIPRSAVVEDLGSPSARTGTVLVVGEGISKCRQVGLGILQENVIEITRGLTEGELVVTAGQHSLQDGEEVTVVKP